MPRGGKELAACPNYMHVLLRGCVPGCVGRGWRVALGSQRIFKVLLKALGSAGTRSQVSHAPSCPTVLLFLSQMPGPNAALSPLADKDFVIHYRDVSLDYINALIECVSEA